MTEPAPVRDESMQRVRRWAGTHVVLGSVLVVVGLLLAGLGVASAGVPFAVFGGLLAALGVFNRRATDGAQRLNRAANAIASGDLAGAQRLVDEALAMRLPGYVRRVAMAHSAVIALRRGKLAACVAHTTAGIEQPLGLLARSQERMHLADLYGLRAFARAATGDAGGARADADAARANELASPQTLARAELAELLVLERAGERVALRAHLGRHRSLLVEMSPPRERAIVRAMARMLEATTATTAYREPAPRDDDDSAREPTLEDWAAVVAPGVAPFVQASRPSDRAETEPGAPPHEAGSRAPAALDARSAARVGLARASGGAGFRRPVLLILAWVACVGLGLGFWQLGSPSHGSGAGDRTVTSALAAFVVSTLPLVVFGVLAAFVVRRIAGARRDRKDLFEASRVAGRGDDAAARPVFERVAGRGLPLPAAQAELSLAILDQRAGDFAGALAHCDRGVGLASRDRTSRVVASFVLLPQLLAERAAVLAAAGRGDEARAELGALEATFPSFHALGAARHRVALLGAAVRGDLGATARAAAARAADLPIDPRVELLGDLALAAAPGRGVGAVEHRRLDREIAAEPAQRAWVGATAPAILAAFEALRDDGEDVEDDARAEAELEAQAIAEAEQPRLDARRLRS